MAMQADAAGFDCLLVGDSVGMVVHGHDTTLPVTVSDMMTHCRAVSRGAQRPFLIGDLPFGSYEASPTQAIETSIRFMKEGNMDAIKLEGTLLTRLTSLDLALLWHTLLCPFHILRGKDQQSLNEESRYIYLYIRTSMESMADRKLQVEAWLGRMQVAMN